MAYKQISATNEELVFAEVQTVAETSVRVVMRNAKKILVYTLVFALGAVLGGIGQMAENAELKGKISVYELEVK